MIKKILLFFWILLTLSSCIKKDCDIPQGFYTFEIPAILTPTKDIYKIGDTISVVSRFPQHEVYERKTDRTYDLTNYKFNPTVDIWEVSNVEIDKTILDDFEVIIDTSIYDFKKFVFSDGTVIYEGNFSNKNGEYVLEYQFVTTKPGLYMFGQSNFTSNSRKHQPFPGKCDSATSGASVRLNAGEDNNPQFLLNSENEYLRTNIYQERKDDFNGFGSFMFYVQE